MSRTINTLPFRIVKELYEGDKNNRWRLHSGYPPAVGGMWPKRKAYTRRRNRQFRRKAKILLQLGKEIPVVKRCVDWDVW